MLGPAHKGTRSTNSSHGLVRFAISGSAARRLHTSRSEWGGGNCAREFITTLQELMVVAPEASNVWQGADASAWPLLDRLNLIASCAAMLGADAVEALIEPLLYEALVSPSRFKGRIDVPFPEA